jgi:hypothetical protein
MSDTIKQILHIKDLTPDPANARAHNPRNIGMIERSLNEVGAARSIVVDEDGVILAGNGLVEAAAQAGIERVRVIEADGDEIIAVQRKGLTSAQKTSLALFDNRTNELSTWDAGQIAALAEDGVDLSGLFFPHELSALLEQAGDEIIDAADLWKGMPEFEQDGNSEFHSLIMHFKTEQDMHAFAELVNQTINKTTKYLYYPKLIHDHESDYLVESHES